MRSQEGHVNPGSQMGRVRATGVWSQAPCRRTQGYARNVPSTLCVGTGCQLEVAGERAPGES